MIGNDRERGRSCRALLTCNLRQNCEERTDSIEVKECPQLVKNSVTRLGLFQNGLVTNFHTNVTQIFGDYLG